MKIKIWQQFASNHSAQYTVVGTFENDQEAQNVARVIEQLLMDMMQWYDQNNKSFQLTPTPAEEKLAEQFGINWQKSIDWVYLSFRFENDHDPLKYFVQIDNRVMIETNYIHTWQPGDQFDSLLKAMGAQVQRDIYNADGPNNTRLFADSLTHVLVIEGLSGQQIEQISEIIQRHIANEDETWPWITFHPYFDRLTDGMDKTVFIEQEQIYLQEHEARNAYIDSHPASKLPQDQFWEWFRIARDSIDARFLHQPEELSVLISRLRHDAKFEKVDIEQVGNKLRLTFDHVYPAASIIPALIGWLRHEGCAVEWNIISSDVIHVYDPSAKDDSA